MMRRIRKLQLTGLYAITKMISTHTASTQLAFICIEKALEGATDDDLKNLIDEIQSLYIKALAIQSVANELNSGSL